MGDFIYNLLMVGFGIVLVYPFNFIFGLFTVLMCIILIYKIGGI